MVCYRSVLAYRFQKSHSHGWGFDAIHQVPSVRSGLVEIMDIVQTCLVCNRISVRRVKELVSGLSCWDVWGDSSL